MFTMFGNFPISKLFWQQVYTVETAIPVPALGQNHMIGVRTEFGLKPWGDSDSQRHRISQVKCQVCARGPSVIRTTDRPYYCEQGRPQEDLSLSLDVFPGTSLPPAQQFSICENGLNDEVQPTQTPGIRCKSENCTLVHLLIYSCVQCLASNMVCASGRNTRWTHLSAPKNTLSSGTDKARTHTASVECAKGPQGLFKQVHLTCPRAEGAVMLKFDFGGGGRYWKQRTDEGQNHVAVRETDSFRGWRQPCVVGKQSTGLGAEAAEESRWWGLLHSSKSSDCEAQTKRKKTQESFNPRSAIIRFAF